MTTAFSKKSDHSMPTIGTIASVGVGVAGVQVEGSYYPNVPLSASLDWAELNAGDLVQVKWDGKRPYIVNLLSSTATTTPAPSVSANRVLCLKDGVSPPTAQAGKVQIYVDAADGQLKAMWGNGRIAVLGVGAAGIGLEQEEV